MIASGGTRLVDVRVTRTRGARASGILAALAMALFACSEEGADIDESSLQATRCDGGTCADPAQDPLVRFEINRNMAHGDSFEVPLDPKRKLHQITMIYDGRYSVPELDANGRPKKNDEGDTYYKDGIYAHGFVLDESGRKQEVSVPKFVDANETDNWHDIPPLSGTKLRVEFAHHERFANDPAVIAAKTTVRMNRVIVQYKDPEGLTSQVFDYDLGSEQKSKAEIPAGGELAIDFDGTKEIYRVDVRWGDAKPRDAKGQYVPGSASGYLTVDRFSSDRRNVAAIETQAFAVQGVGPVANGKHRIAVHMQSDKGRVHWVKVFYR